MPQILKSGYLKKFSKSIVNEEWKKVYVEFESDGYFHWFKNKNSSSKKTANLQIVKEYFATGKYCGNIPHCPSVPYDGKIDYMFAFPEEITRSSKVHFFLCESEDQLKEWMSTITSTFPAYQPSTANLPQRSYPTAPNPDSTLFGPSFSSPQTNPLIGFEALAISNRPSTPQYAPLNAYPPQNNYPRSYTPQPVNPPPMYPQQQQMYPVQGYPNQQYYMGRYQQPMYMAQGYPSQQYYTGRNQYPQYYPQAYGGSIPNIPGSMPQQTIIIQDRHSSTPGLNMAAGFLGGAILGSYMAPPLYYGGLGGYGCGMGWGRGSWGSWSCSSGSWGSF